MSGRLFIVATPIGNLSDVSLRTREAIDSADLVLAEDTRVTIKLLNHLGLKKRMISCHEFNEAGRLSLIVEANKLNQTIALISDAGTPLISDPGYQIVREAIALDMTIVPLPGPSAFLLALVGSGLPCERFVFEGFLPDKPAHQKSRLEELKNEERTIVFYMSPHKLVKQMELMRFIFADRQACIAREITKLHEEFVRGSLATLIQKFSTQEIRGEFVLVVGGRPPNEVNEAVNIDQVRAAIRSELDSGRSVKDISPLLAEQFGMKKSDLYRLALEEQDLR